VIRAVFFSLLFCLIGCTKEATDPESLAIRSDACKEEVSKTCKKLGTSKEDLHECVEKVREFGHSSDCRLYLDKNLPLAPGDLELLRPKLSVQCKDDLLKYCPRVPKLKSAALNCLNGFYDSLSRVCKMRIDFDKGACTNDIPKLCNKVVSGGGRITKCLLENRKITSSDCRTFLNKYYPL
jgi:hypothetical protein